MARPIKEGLDYCSLDTDIFSDRKIRRLLKTFGAKGFTIYIVVLCEVYRDKGYYMEWDGELAFDISDNIPGVSEQLVKEVINFCIECGLFDKSVFSSKNTLTSHGIQKRYKKAKEGGRVVIVPEIWVMDQITTVIPDKPTVNQSISTQSKVKESKVNKSKGEEITAPAIPEEISDPLKTEIPKTDTPPAENPSPPVARAPSSTIPTMEEALREAKRLGGTEEMGTKFWNKYEGLGWKNGITHIANWKPFLNNFIANFYENERKNGEKRKNSQPTGAIIQGDKDYIPL
ncbi:Lin1244/Lin1753 domain-containing protein [Chitinophaga sp. RCC_12]|uniref:DUF4373 domain-containing protein n=1 Tax=Chitinophaga sp. RCC_12 TaxID=3239226 RepID=UPI0035267499